MRTVVLGSLLFLLASAGGACALGRQGLGGESAGAGAVGAGAGTTTTDSLGGSTTTTTSSVGGGETGGWGGTGSGGDGGTGGSGGTPPLPVCDDGVVDPPEQCEDGNTTSGDGCDAGCELEASCGNSTVEPGEACDALADCVDCEPAGASACLGAAALPMGVFSGDTTGSTLTTFGNVPGDFPLTDCTSKVSPSPIGLYRHAVGAYPEGIAVLVRPSGYPFDDSVAWSYLGCAAKPLACDDDNWNTWFYGNGSLMFTPLMPARSVVFVAITEFDANAAGSFTAYAKRFRYGTWFSRGLGGMTLDAGWTGPSAGRIRAFLSSNVPADTSATTPDLYVAGLDTVEVVFEQQLSAYNGASASVEISFDGGPWQATSFASAVGTDNDPADLEIATLARPAGALHASVRFRLRDNGAYSGASWGLDGVLVGAPAL